MTGEPNEPIAATPELPTLTTIEARALGCLVEKAATTPDVYPLTLNSLHLACNQKTSRDPVMNLEVGEVGHALHTLEEKKLVRVARGARVLRYEHTIDAPLGLTPRSRALIAMLLLRGPQTQAELHARCERLADFPDAEMIADTLDRLMQREPALVICLGRSSGQREDRYMHLLCGPVSLENLPVARADSGGNRSRTADLEARIDELERIVEQLRNRIDACDQQ
ncbi:MAG TPA: YceH family protein [Rudaea sp.]|nr:YceH family protein [Rudaea sp.]